MVRNLKFSTITRNFLSTQYFLQFVNTFDQESPKRPTSFPRPQNSPPKKDPNPLHLPLPGPHAKYLNKKNFRKNTQQPSNQHSFASLSRTARVKANKREGNWREVATRFEGELNGSDKFSPGKFASGIPISIKMIRYIKPDSECRCT